MEKMSVFLGKDQNSGVLYLNDRKYGYFITNKLHGNSQNYKVPEHLKPEEITLDLAQRIIQYKNKRSKQYLVPKGAFNNNESDCDEDGDKCDIKMTTSEIEKQNPNKI